MGQFPRLPTPIEMHVVALIARGDTYEDIRADVLARFERSISAGTITMVKKRNSEAITSIKQAVMDKEQDDAIGLLARSRRIIGKRLRDAEKGESSIKDSDLVSISKEMFHQSRIESGAGDDAQKLINPREKLKELQDLLEENDEIKLERIVFVKRDSSSESHAGPNPDSSGDGPNDGIPLQGGDIPPNDNPDPQET